MQLEKIILSEEEIGKINNKYDFGVKDEFMTKRYINIEKNNPIIWFFFLILI